MPYKDPAAQRAYQARWVAERRRQFLEDKVCVDCSGTEDLNLDHVDPATKIDHRIWSWSESRRAAEIAKCAVRCHSCHVKKSKANGDVPVAQHGSIHKYNLGCRCEPCKAARRVKYVKQSGRHSSVGRASAS
jgi:hypothetical protein